jgi:hypothetical protein
MQHQQAVAGLLQGELQFHELDLQPVQRRLVCIAVEFVVIGKAAGAERRVLDLAGELRCIDIERRRLAGLGSLRHRLSLACWSTAAS